MICLAYLIIFFTLVQLIIALVNLVFYQSLEASDINYEDIVVSVLIPARNEENNIAYLIEDLQKQDHCNLEILIFNDQSTDKTAQIVAGYESNDKRIKLFNSAELPVGWLGKNFACHSLAQQARGDFFLFLDADVRLKSALITKTLGFVIRHKLALLSIFPKQEMKSLGEWFTVPIMNYILLTLLPLILVRKSSFVSLSAANGQFMLFDAEIYRSHAPHKLLKLQRVEDIEISRYFKKNSIPLACIASTDLVSCRMYNSFNQAVNGFSRNFPMFFGNSFLIATLFWLVSTFGPIVVWYFSPIALSIFYLVTVILTRLVVSVISKQNLLKNLVYAVPQQISMGLILFWSIFNRANNRYRWKGRLV